MADAGTLVFVVDDDEAARFGLSLLVRSFGLPVRAFESARTCLEAALSDHPVCIVSDLDMPDMNGAEMLMALNEQGSTVPVIFVTGKLADSPLIELARSAGARSLLRKPVDDSDLLRAIEQALARSTEEGSSYLH